MSLVAVACVAVYGRNVPLSEDWTLVPALTDHEPNVVEWLWSQNNEHRVPVPKLILVGLLKLTGGDFRAGMVLNVVSLAGLAAAMILTARRIRNGRNTYSDAFFPIVILHLGNWENLFWGWQFSFVSSILLIGGLLLFVLTHSTPIPPRTAFLAGSALVLLPLTGATGLLFVPLVALYLVAHGIRQWRQPSTDAPTWSTVWLLALPLFALALTCLYFVGYESPTWYPASKVNTELAQTSLKFLSMGFGPASARSWRLFAIVITVLLACTAVLLLSSVKPRSPNRSRASGLLVVLAGVMATALGVGRGRAALAHQRLPHRYVLLAVPALLAAYFAWELYGSARARRAVRNALFVVVLLLLPLNVKIGLGWRNWYVSGMNSVQRDVESGLSLPQLAEKHQNFLLHWDLEALKANMRMLRDAGMGPFRNLSSAPPGPNGTK